MGEDYGRIREIRMGRECGRNMGDEVGTGIWERIW